MSESTILLCEDDDSLRRVFAKHLTKAGHNVIEAANGQEALDILGLEPVDLVLSDVMMPRVDGMELCARVKAASEWARIPVILLTARDSTASQVAGLDCGADDYIVKPPEPAILLARIRRALKRAQDVKSQGRAEAIAGLTLGRVIGSGTFGEVYQAHDICLERDVAVKIIRQRFVDDTEACERFLREGKAMCAVRHPGVVAVHAVGEHQGKPYIIMEYLTGGDLATRRDRPFGVPTKEVLGIARQVADALAHLHRAGIVHRDIKPENILFDREDRAVLVDFGIALVAATSRMTLDGTVMGTLPYMAPEQFDERSVDSRADLYALGVVMYELLAGFVPIRAGSFERMMAKILSDEPKHLNDMNLELEPQAGDVVMRLLAKDPDTRFQTAEDLVAALDGLAD